jgi:ferredoxin
MKAIVDSNLCEGNGMCAATVPEVFDLNEDSELARVLVDDVPTEMEESARHAASSCPRAAIRLES